MKNRMKNKLSCYLILSIVSTLPLAVTAADSNKTYFSAGMMNWTSKSLNELQVTGVTIDDSAIVTNFTVGMPFSQYSNLYLEGGIISSGEVSASVADGTSGTINGKAYTVNAVATVKAKTDTTYMLGLKYSGGNGPLSINIKSGLLFWDIDYTADINGTITYDGTAYSVSTSLDIESKDGSDPYFGFGMSYALSNNSSLDFDYISSEIHDDSMSGYSLSWVRKF